MRSENIFSSTGTEMGDEIFSQFQICESELTPRKLPTEMKMRGRQPSIHENRTIFVAIHHHILILSVIQN